MQQTSPPPLTTEAAASTPMWARASDAGTSTFAFHNGALCVDWQTKTASLVYNFSAGVNFVPACGAYPQTPAPVSDTATQTPLANVPNINRVPCTFGCPRPDAGQRPVLPRTHYIRDLLHNKGQPTVQGQSEPAGEPSPAQNAASTEEAAPSDSPVSVEEGHQERAGGAPQGPIQTNITDAAASPDASSARPGSDETNATANEGLNPSNEASAVKAEGRGKKSIRLFPQSHRTRIRNTKSSTHWYSTSSSRALGAVPARLLKPFHTSIYVHMHKRGTQLWVYLDPSRRGRRALRLGAGTSGGREGEGTWMEISEGFEHPDLDGYVLHLKDEEGTQPQWVKEKTYTNVKRRRQRMARCT